MRIWEHRAPSAENSYGVRVDEQGPAKSDGSRISHSGTGWLRTGFNCEQDRRPATAGRGFCHKRSHSAERVRGVSQIVRGMDSAPNGRSPGRLPDLRARIISRKYGPSDVVGADVVERAVFDHADDHVVCPVKFPDQGAGAARVVVQIFGNPLPRRVVDRMDGLLHLRQPPDNLLT